MNNRKVTITQIDITDASYPKCKVEHNTFSKGDNTEACKCIGGCLEFDCHGQKNKKGLPKGMRCQLKGKL